MSLWVPVDGYDERSVPMLGERTNIVVCHGCGTFHEKTSRLPASPLAMAFEEPGAEAVRNWIVPVWGCPTCAATPGVIRKAFDQGSSPAARAKAQAEFTMWLPRLRALHRRQERQHRPVERRGGLDSNSSLNIASAT
jgi:hypothetical protein